MIEVSRRQILREALHIIFEPFSQQNGINLFNLSVDQGLNPEEFIFLQLTTLFYPECGYARFLIDSMKEDEYSSVNLLNSMKTSDFKKFWDAYQELSSFFNEQQTQTILINAISYYHSIDIFNTILLTKNQSIILAYLNYQDETSIPTIVSQYVQFMSQDNYQKFPYAIVFSNFAQKSPTFIEEALRQRQLNPPIIDELISAYLLNLNSPFLPKEIISLFINFFLSSVISLESKLYSSFVSYLIFHYPECNNTDPVFIFEFCVQRELFDFPFDMPWINPVSLSFYLKHLLSNPSFSKQDFNYIIDLVIKHIFELNPDDENTKQITKILVEDLIEFSSEQIFQLVYTVIIQFFFNTEIYQNLYYYSSFLPLIAEKFEFSKMSERFKYYEIEIVEKALLNEQSDLKLLNNLTPFNIIAQFVYSFLNKCHLSSLLRYESCKIDILIGIYLIKIYSIPSLHNDDLAMQLLTQIDFNDLNSLNIHIDNLPNLQQFLTTKVFSPSSFFEFISETNEVLEIPNKLVDNLTPLYDSYEKNHYQTITVQL